MEEYSEGKIHKSEPEPRNGNVNTVYFINRRPGEILESLARSLFTMNEHAFANVYLNLGFLLRIMFVNVRIFRTKFEGRCKYFSPIKPVSLRKLAPPRNVDCTGTSSIRMAWTLSLKYLSVKPRLLMKKCCS